MDLKRLLVPAKNVIFIEISNLVTVCLTGHATYSRVLFLCPWDRIRRMSRESGCSFWREIIFSESLTIFIGQWLIFNDFYQKWIIWWIMILMVADWIQISCVTVDLKSTKSASRLFFRLESVLKRRKSLKKLNLVNFEKIWEKKAKNPSRKSIILTEIEIFEENWKNVAIEILYIFSNNFDGKFLSCKSGESDCILVLSDGFFGLCREFRKLWRFDSANWSRSKQSQCDSYWWLIPTIWSVSLSNTNVQIYRSHYWVSTILILKFVLTGWRSWASTSLKTPCHIRADDS